MFRTYIPSRHLLAALASIILLISLCATPSLAAQDFQLHVENRLAAKPTTLPTTPAAIAVAPAASAPQWSTDLSVVLDQPFSATFVDGHTTTSIQGTVHKNANNQFRLSISVKRVVTEQRPGDAFPIANTTSFRSTLETPLSKEFALGGGGADNAAMWPTTFVTLSPAPANP